MFNSAFFSTVPVWVPTQCINFVQFNVVVYKKFAAGKKTRIYLYTNLRNIPNVRRIDHGCARMAHCVTPRWRNFSHYCCPLGQYDVWFTCSDHREAPTDAPISTLCTQTKVHSARGKYIVRHWASREFRYVTAVDGGLEAFHLSIVFCAPVVYPDAAT